MTLTPAYGRDYSSAKAAKADFYAGKDFIVNDFHDPYDGKPVNIQDLRQTETRRVTLRFSSLRKVTVVDVTEG